MPVSEVAQDCIPAAKVRSTVTDGNGTLRCLKSLRACAYGICCIDTRRRKGFKWSNEVDTALPTMLCAARTQVVAAHQLLGVPKLSTLQSAGVLRKTPQWVLRIFPCSLSPEASAGRMAGVRLRGYATRVRDTGAEDFRRDRLPLSLDTLEARGSLRPLMPTPLRGLPAQRYTSQSNQTRGPVPPDQWPPLRHRTSR